MDIYIYYWKNNKWMINLSEKLPTRRDFKKDYKRLHIKFPYRENLDDESNLERIFDILNRDDNPLGSKENQKWIGKNLLPQPHTSISTGDIARIGRSYWIVDTIGWKKLRWR